MKNNKDSRIEIRLPLNIKEKFQKVAKEKNMSISKMLYNYILSVIKEDEK